jgi:hypothetical protein
MRKPCDCRSLKNLSFDFDDDGTLVLVPCCLHGEQRSHIIVLDESNEAVVKVTHVTGDGRILGYKFRILVDEENRCDTVSEG